MTRQKKHSVGFRQVLGVQLKLNLIICNVFNHKYTRDRVHESKKATMQRSPGQAIADLYNNIFKLTAPFKKPQAEGV